MNRLALCSLVVAWMSSWSPLVQADDEYNVQIVDETAPADDLSADVAAQLSPTGFKVIKGESRTVCSFWPVKSLKVDKAFQASASRLYPLEMGQLVGVIHFKKDAEDFRGQEVESGTYTVRFALQPEDGNHVGTSDTRDFLVLLKPADDASPAVMAKEELFPKSAAAAGTTHPAMMALLSAADTTGDLPSLQHDEGRELWSVAFAPIVPDGKLTMRIVVVGRAAE